MKDLKLLLIAIVGIVTLIGGGSMLEESLGVTSEQGAFFGGIVFVGVVVFLVWIIIRVKKEEDE